VSVSRGRQASPYERLAGAIASKLEANRAVLDKGPRYGRIIWRIERNGEIEIDLEPKL
jgi:hypothetical protein